MQGERPLQTHKESGFFYSSPLTPDVPAFLQQAVLPFLADHNWMSYRLTQFWHEQPRVSTEPQG